MQQIFSFSRLSDAERFAEAALVATHRRGLERATEVCVVQDGAECYTGSCHQGPARVLMHLAQVAARYPNEASQEKLSYVQ
jgi:hypothetical protein